MLFRLEMLLLLVFARVELIREKCYEIYSYQYLKLKNYSFPVHRVSFSVILFGSLEAIVRSRRSLFKIAARAVKCEKKSAIHLSDNR